MAATRPHHIPHDHKWQSRGDFEKSLSGFGKARTAPTRNSFARRGSVFSDNGSTLVDRSDRSSSGSSEVPPKLDEIDEKPPKWDDDEMPPKLDKEDRPPKWEPVLVVLPVKSRRRCCWLWLILILLVLAVIANLIAFFVTRDHSSGGGVLGNSSAASTVIIVSSQALTSMTIIEGGGTITTVITAAPSIATTTQSAEPSTTTVVPPPAVTPAAVQGFDIWKFYNGDMMMVYEADGSIWTKQHQSGSWNSPSLVASGAKPGTSVRIFGWVETDDYDGDGLDWGDGEDYGSPAYGLTYWTVYFVDNNFILQEMVMALSSSGYSSNYAAQLPDMSGLTWYAGVLGSEGYQWQVSDTLYFEGCTWGALLQSETSAAGYIYLDAAGGGITKLGTSLTEWWAIGDLPSPVVGSSKAITCASRVDQIENLWLINEDGALQQWWLNATAVGADDDTSLDWIEGITYNTTVLPNTTLEAWSTPLSDIIFYQAPNTSLMFFNVLGEGSTAHISPEGSLVAAAVADPGTHLTTGTGATVAPAIASYENATFNMFYVYYQNGSEITAESMRPDPGTGVVVAGGPGGDGTEGEQGSGGGDGDGDGDGGDGDDGINISGAVRSSGLAVSWAWFVGLGAVGWLVL